MSVVARGHAPAAPGPGRSGPPGPGLAGQTLAWARAHRVSLAIVLVLLTVTGVVHAWGMAAAPQRLDDEGTYVSQAWAVQHWRTLAHYTYWYDHPPLGWILLACYATVTGAFARAPSAVAAGREFMLICQLASAALLYLVARRLGLRRGAAAGAVLLFSLSPLAVEFHRAVYLDNIATPFVLAAFALALSPGRRLAAHAGSGLCFGAAVLCKETALLLLPPLTWQLWRGTDPRTRRYSLAVAGSLLVLAGSFYLLYAALRGELLPGPSHVSLVDGVAFQLFTRKVSGSPLDPSSPSHQTVLSWLARDRWLMLTALALIPAGLAIRRSRPVTVGLAILAAVVARPGYLPIPFAIGLLPLAALVVATVADTAWGRPPHHRQLLAAATSWPTRRAKAGRALRAAAVAGVVLAAVGVAGPGWRDRDLALMTVDQDAPMAAAERWIGANLPRSSRILVDDSLWVDLVRRGFAPHRTVWFWKLDRDPEIRARYPHGWRDFDYVVSTTAVRGSVHDLPQVSEALRHATVAASFGRGEYQVEVLRIHAGVA